LPGKHRLSPDLTWEEIKNLKHGLPISYIYDTSRYLTFKYKCLCTENIQDVLLGAFDKKTGEFFNIFNKNGEPKITNDLGGPDFTLLACVYPNLLIGIAEANMCSEEFVQKYQMRGDDNQVLVMMECRQR
jgi:hypothetical protein